MNVKEWERQRKPRHPGPWYHTVQRGLVNVKIKCACFSRSILKVKSQQQEILILMPKWVKSQERMVSPPITWKKRPQKNHL